MFSMFDRYAEDTMRKLSDVTLKQCPLTMNETASVYKMIVDQV